MTEKYLSKNILIELLFFKKRLTKASFIKLDHERKKIVSGQI
jgi:hypothetical protein